MKILFPPTYSCLIILGPTAVGKTAVGVSLADYFDGEVLSADSRQVYRGLDIGSGKDLSDFALKAETEKTKLPGRELQKERSIPWHLMDVAELPHEYSVFKYQQDFYRVFADVVLRKKLPVIIGGTGMYLDSIIRGYDLVDVPTNEELRNQLAGKSIEELTCVLRNVKEKCGEKLHNDTDITERHRLLRAIEIATFELSGNSKSQRSKMPPRPDIRPLIIGTTFPRPMLRAGIKKRLKARLKEGMIQEVQDIHDGNKKASDGTPVAPVAWDRLERLGLEYRFVSQYLQGQFESFDEMSEQLYRAIGQFAKRQETWYRGMIKKGVVVNWLPHDGTKADCEVHRRVLYALNLIKSIK
ncbi:MAG TPA: tRNA (adenosine(37)-N6)-dimethylallyltransferase MiaA [Treponemataceae bacterium]|nr:tRNA (adenosine(37)-N6)-dimethylallyltransferase MiaA [Treponemataceae bacterium]